MPVVAAKELVDRAFTGHNGIAAIDVVIIAAHPAEYDQPSLFVHQRAQVLDKARDSSRLFGSEGKAW